MASMGTYTLARLSYLMMATSTVCATASPPESLNGRLVNCAGPGTRLKSGFRGPLSSTSVAASEFVRIETATPRRSRLIRRREPRRPGTKYGETKITRFWAPPNVFRIAPNTPGGRRRPSLFPGGLAMICILSAVSGIWFCFKSSVSSGNARTRSR